MTAINRRGFLATFAGMACAALVVRPAQTHEWVELRFPSHDGWDLVTVRQRYLLPMGCDKVRIPTLTASGFGSFDLVDTGARSGKGLRVFA